MSEPGPKSRARLVLPSGVVSEDFLAGLPDVVSDVLRGTCDIMEADPSSEGTPEEFGDPRVAAALDSLGEGVAVVVGRGEIIWMNDRLASHTPEMLRRFGDACREAIDDFSRHPLKAGRGWFPFILGRFSAVPGPAEGLRRPKIVKNLPS